MAVLPGSSGLDSADNWNARQIFYTEDKALVPIETDPEIRLGNQRRITFSWGKVLGQLFIMFALYCGKIMEMVRETENTTKTGKAMIYTVATVIVGTVALVFLTMQIVMLFLDKDTEERRYDRIAEFPSSFEELGGYTFEEGWSEKS